MSFRHRHLRQICVIFPRVFPGSQLRSYNEAARFSLSSLVSASDTYNETAKRRNLSGGFCFRRYSTIPQISNVTSVAKVDCLSFINGALDELEGQHHCWVNRDERCKDFFKRDGTFLVLAAKVFENLEIVNMLEKVKSLQQRFPQLNVMVFHTGSSCFVNDKTSLFDLIMKEYITFPILLSYRSILEMDNGPCYILFKDFKNPSIYHEVDVDLGVLDIAVEELYEHNNGNFENSISSTPILKSTWWKEPEIIKEPYLSSPLQNLLLYFPGCVSADESGCRLFLSDSNHHRVIIFDDSGKILDCIGSSPGFEDGEFDSAKLARPAASFYDDEEDCLYIVDSENHAIRRADMKRRVLETLHPTFSITKERKGFWSRLFDKFSIGKDANTKSEDFDSHSLLFPWHLLKSDDSFYIISRRFEALWIMKSDTGEIKQFIKGFSEILETCGDLVMEKISLIKQMPTDWLQQEIDSKCLEKELLYASLISSAAIFENDTVMCDTVSHRVLKLHGGTGACSNFQFSSLGILGFPYWLSFPLEEVYSVTGPWGEWIHYLQHFELLPGRIDIRVNIEIPTDTELVEPLEEGCTLRQARGAAIEVIGAKDVLGSSEKVGLAQQWYDEMENLAFSPADEEIKSEEDNETSDAKLEDEKIYINCTVNTSPGTSEVVICAALYLKLKSNLGENNQELLASRIADIAIPGKRGGMERDLFIQHLLKRKQDLRDLVVMRPLHVRIKLNTPLYPKAENNKDIILTNSSIEVNASLQA